MDSSVSDCPFFCLYCMCLVENMSVARKLFRLFKSFNEYVKIKNILKEETPALDKTLSVLARLGFLFYWIFDNLSVLIKVKFF